MLSLAQQTLQDTAKTRDAAADFLSRLLTRPDMEHTHLDNFIVWARQGLDSPDTFLVSVVCCGCVVACCVAPHSTLALEDWHLDNPCTYIQNRQTRCLDEANSYHIREVDIHDDWHSLSKETLHQTHPTPGSHLFKTRDCNMALPKRYILHTTQLTLETQHTTHTKATGRYWQIWILPR